MKFLSSAFAVALLSAACSVESFAPLRSTGRQSYTRAATLSQRFMALDPVSYLRTEWVSAALCTNQTPRTADVCLQLGTEDGRAVTFLPRTIREFMTSSADASGTISVSVRRQLKQNQQRRGIDTKLTIIDQRADDLKETPNDSVDIVISLQAAAKLHENGLDWKQSVREAARVLKPGGRLLFCEQTEIEGESYLEYAQGLMSITGDVPENEDERFPIFEEGGADTVPMCPIPHIAGVAVKSENAGLSLAQRKARDARAEKERLADLSIQVFESQGRMKRKRRKKDKDEEAAPVSSNTKA
jgi:SAM-dependent methyltransferase